MDQLSEIKDRQADGYEAASKGDTLDAATLMLKDIRYLLARLEETQRLVVFYQGEGEPDIPEEEEYRKLASIPNSKRTAEQTERLRFLANFIVQELGTDELRAQRESLRTQLATAEKKLGESEREQERLRGMITDRTTIEMSLRKQLGEQKATILTLTDLLGFLNVTPLRLNDGDSMTLSMLTDAAHAALTTAKQSQGK